MRKILIFHFHIIFKFLLLFFPLAKRYKIFSWRIWKGVKQRKQNEKNHFQPVDVWEIHSSIYIHTFISNNAENMNLALR